MGYSVLCLTRDGSEQIVDIGVITTKKADKKLKAYAGDDNHRCSQILADGLDVLVEGYQPSLIVAEAQSGSKNSRAAQLMGMAWGVVSTVAAIHGIPVLQARPTQIKKACTGKGQASKEEIQEAVTVQFPASPEWLLNNVKPKSLHEHVYDSLSVYIACRDSTEVQTLKQVIKNMSNTPVPTCPKCKRSVLKCTCSDNDLDK